MLSVLVLFFLVFSDETVSYLNHDSYKLLTTKKVIYAHHDVPSVFADSGWLSRWFMMKVREAKQSFGWKFQFMFLKKATALGSRSIAERRRKGVEGEEEEEEEEKRG